MNSRKTLTFGRGRSHVFSLAAKVCLGGAALVIAAEMAAATVPCWTLVVARCCVGYTTQCNIGDVSWDCISNVTGTEFIAVAALSITVPGKDKVDPVEVGDCVIIVTGCGVTPGECEILWINAVGCTTDVLSGPGCNETGES